MILVTGATGNVGRPLVHQLVEAGLPVRALTRRDPATAGLPRAAEVVRGDLETIGDCLDGVESAFLVWPFHTADAAPAVVKAIGRHARRIVLLSSGAVRDQPDSFVGRSHQEVEQCVEQAGPAWTILRPSTFAANVLWWAGQIRAGNVVRGAYGAVPMAMLHERDIAAVAARALTAPDPAGTAPDRAGASPGRAGASPGRAVASPGYDGARLVLTGPQVLTQAEQVRIIGEALGRPLRWQELTRAEERRRLLADGSFPDSFADALLDGYARMFDGPPPALTTTVEEVTGRPARTFAQWARDHAADFA
ncbi:NAD-dependent epimerase/dehydratase family protein [Nonomuraea zeae]|uniref:NAD-dependent epimerase/dehydratase family protein n=2 Tax=Nonomuraea zeae TaxID=1642303 RepID=A0A5S4GL31_9ACTN|nr:NAD-dependent epimerase/dehydratase family protein [Nonomuraea zeae]